MKILSFPQNKKEKLLYTLIVSCLAVATITPAVNFCQQGLGWNVFMGVVKSFPLVWVVAVSCLAITRYPVGQLKRFLSEETDSYNAKIALNIISNVVFMSMIMTIAGS